MEEKGIERLKRKKAGRRGNRSKGGKYEKKGRDRSLLKFYTLGKRKKLPQKTFAGIFAQKALQILEFVSNRDESRRKTA